MKMTFNLKKKTSSREIYIQLLTDSTQSDISSCSNIFYEIQFTIFDVKIS